MLTPLSVGAVPSWNERRQLAPSEREPTYGLTQEREACPESVQNPTMSTAS
jgi:hypothetical protein